MSENRYLSIITNFGCHYECPYCAVKNCGINVPKTTVEGLQGLERAVDEYEANWISVSGGGDPFYKLEKHTDWWNKLFSIVFGDDEHSGLDVKLELHTSYLTYEYEDDGNPFWPFNRVVYHCRKPSDLFKIKRYGGQIIRAVFVVTAEFTEELINDIYTIVKHHPMIDELSFRQMIDKDYNATDYCSEYLKAGHKDKWWYIEQADYNIYYAENEVKFRYEDFRLNEVKTGLSRTKNRKE